MSRPTAAQLLATHREVWWEFDVLTAEVRCDCRRDLRPGEPIVARVSRRKGPKPSKFDGIAVGEVMCVPCGTLALGEHRRVVAGLEWRAEREAAHAAEQRARALAEQMLTYESPPEDALAFAGTVARGETVAAGGGYDAAVAACEPSPRRSGFEPSNALLDRQRFDALSSLADVHGVPPRREGETDEQLRARILRSWGRR